MQWYLSKCYKYEKNPPNTVYLRDGHCQYLKNTKTPTKTRHNDKKTPVPKKENVLINKIFTSRGRHNKRITHTGT